VDLKTFVSVIGTFWEDLSRYEDFLRSASLLRRVISVLKQFLGVLLRQSGVGPRASALSGGNPSGDSMGGDVWYDMSPYFMLRTSHLAAEQLYSNSYGFSAMPTSLRGYWSSRLCLC
jgi:hypothetical protein